MTATPSMLAFAARAEPAIATLTAGVATLAAKITPAGPTVDDVNVLDRVASALEAAAVAVTTAISKQP